jgi:NADH dehydrogenase [ubiquinone] 1 alpha subcomplex assembly factor 1
MNPALLLALVPTLGSEPSAALRTEAAETLAEARSRSVAVREAGATGLPALIAGARATAVELEGTRSASRLLEAAEAASWMALADQGRAAEELTALVQQVEADLRFQPYIEAELPVGFPEPTPAGEIEVKQYPVYRMARTDMSGGAFWQLFNHIKKNDIAMTAPVEMTWASTENGMREVDMAFLYGNVDLGPVGQDGAVEVVEAEPAAVVSIGCRGEATRAAVNAAYDELLAWLALRGDLEVSGPMRGMAYNSPMVPRSRKYFEVQIPVTLLETSALGANALDMEAILDPTSPDEPGTWQVVNDTVMGGRSASEVRGVESGLLFTGDLSLENNGGFASVRRPVPDGLSEGADRFVLRVRGDGKTYKLRARTDGRFDGVSYERPFDTVAGEVLDLELPLAEFRPVWRGRTVPGQPELTAAAVRQLGLLISDKQEGTFALEVLALGVR